MVLTTWPARHDSISMDLFSRPWLLTSLWRDTVGLTFPKPTWTESLKHPYKWNRFNAERWWKQMSIFLRGQKSVSEEKSDRKYSKFNYPSFMRMHVYGLFICEYLSSIVGRPVAASSFIWKLSTLWWCLRLLQRMWGDAGYGWVSEKVPAAHPQMVQRNFHNREVCNIKHEKHPSWLSWTPEQARWFGCMTTFNFKCGIVLLISSRLHFLLSFSLSLRVRSACCLCPLSQRMDLEHKQAFVASL